MKLIDSVLVIFSLVKHNSRIANICYKREKRRLPLVMKLNGLMRNDGRQNGAEWDSPSRTFEPVTPENETVKRFKEPEERKH